ncbi:RNA polymerase III subunit RPC82 [Xylariaceae sp. FL0255]|nr:RNA polymerase III subunit RPC82 [Xylariaceae sp. FL0255]
MLLTKNAAELCALLVSELYGQLPSRIIAALLARGRSNVRELTLHTSLTYHQVRHGLALAIQHNLVLYHIADKELEIARYEANPLTCYHLVRVGKILDLIDRNYGPLAKQLVDHLLTLGNVEIAGLVQYYTTKAGKGHKKATANGVLNHEDDADYDEEYDEEYEEDYAEGNNEHDLQEDDPFAEPDQINGHTNGEINGDTNGHVTVEDIATTDQIYDTLAQLIAAGIIESVSTDMLEPPQDLRLNMEAEVAKEFPDGVRGARLINERDARVNAQLRSIGFERSSLKRKLQDSAMQEPSNIKRRKLVNGGVSEISNGFAGSDGASILQAESNATIRLNFDKCMVELRNQKLVEYAEDFVGDTTSKVFAALLSVMCRKVYRCQYDQYALISEEEEEANMSGVRVTTDEIFEHLGADVDVFTGIGTASEDEIDIQYAEKIRKFPPQPQTSSLQETLEDGDEVMVSDDEEYDRSEERPNGLKVNGNRSHSGKNGVVNGDGHSDDDLTSRLKQKRQMRQHLLLLAEAKQRFVRHCGPNLWTVDFGPLIQQLRFAEIDTMIEASFGRQGLRLTRILREKGKLDDKTLPSLALMKKIDVHVIMAAMEVAGFLEVQEVPRDTNRAANRTIFFWFFDEKRTLKRILDNTYKTMVRCLQRLEVERYKKKNVLSVAERKDVQGFEEEKLRGDVYKEYLEYLDTEKKLLSQMMRLDDLIAICQDF